MLERRSREWTRQWCFCSTWTNGWKGCDTAVSKIEETKCVELYPSHVLSSDCSLKGTDWGDLDVLVLDLPPGTGDVQLTVCQDVDLSGAVGVTTPSKLALADARKGIEMFSKLGIPTMAMVENMAYFDVSITVQNFAK